MAIKSFLSENGFSVGSVGSTPIDVIDVAGNVTGVSLTSSGGIITANTSIPALRARDNITGPGGTISVDASYNISWTGRFIVISNGGTASTFSASGYFDINQPAVGTVITGLNGASNATVVSAGIPLAQWHALYYILPIGSGATSVDANFRIVSYTANNLNIPAEWIQICLRNGDNGYVYFPNGVVLTAGNSSAYSGQSSANVANTAVKRDASGNFSAGTITATLSGNATTATTAGNVSGTVAIGNGGTGQTTATSANTAIGNWGQLEAHGTYQDLNTVPATWGFSFVQGSTNAPHGNSGQWYRGRFSLGSGYGIGTAGGSYWLEMAMPRSAGNSYGNMYFRVNESGTVSSWYPVSGITTNSLTAGSYLTGGTFNGSAAVTIAVDATSSNTASKIVARDAAGGFSAATIAAQSFSDGYNTYTLAQINRAGGAVELQYNTTTSGSNVNIFGNTANRWAWQADTGKLVLGSAGDTNLYRGGADILKTDDAFEANSLTAVSSATTQISINSTGSGSKELVFKNNGTVAGYVWHTGGYVALGGGSASTSLAVLTSNGNVGIGTAGPSVKLEVYGADQRMKISTSAVDAGSLTIGQWDGVTNRIESSNRKLLLTSYSGGISLGASGSEHVQISMAGALTSTTSTSSPIYYDSANSNFYCDPAGTSSLAGATLSSDPASDRSAITRVWSTSRGENLVTNGSGLMGSNYNFSGFTFDAVQTHGGGGSFRKNVATGSGGSDELMPVDIEKTYRLVAWARSGEDGGTNYNPSNFQYLGITPLDIDGNLVDPFSYSKYPGSTDTTLAVALNTGATTMTLTSAAGWLNTAGAGAYQRQMVWYGYTNSKGYTYPNYTYTRNNSYYTSSTYQANGMWAAGGISGNVVTLTAPWPGPNIPAGTAVRNTNSGGTYKYITIAGAVPNTWTRYEGYIGGIDTGGEQLTNKFPYGTAFVKLLFLFNYHGLADNNIRYSDIWFSETSSRNLEGATADFSGVVTTGTQSFAGNKTFSGSVTSAGFYNSTDSTNRFVQGSLVLRNSAPTVYFRDTDNNSAMIHVNSNILYVLRGSNDTETYTQVNGVWPLEINLTNNNATFGGTVTAASFIGNASTATTLQNARNIAGVSFNGSADISITGQNITTSVATAANDLEVAKYLRWKNYGNGHVLIDASQGTAPTGAAIDRYTAGQTITNAGAGSNTWGEAISLMGWNGTTTYGVRVDRARTIDNQANSATTTAATANTASAIVLRDGSGNFSAGTITASLSGNASSATTWQTARTLTIGATGKSVDGSANVSWSAAEIGLTSYLPLSGGTLTGKVTFPSAVSDRPQFPGGILGLDTSDGNFDIWGISRDYYPSHGTAANQWGIRWDGDSNQVRFIGGGTNRLVIDLDGGASALTWEGSAVLHAANYNSYAPTLTGTGASGTWGISITGNAATATSADQIDGVAFRNTGSNAGTAADSLDQNGITYVNSNISLLGQTDGALFSQAYSSAWQHQIYGDYRTGQIVVRGKNNGTWQAWRTVLDSTNYTSYTGHIGNGTLTLNTSGSGISGSASFTANQSGNATFTVTSNATVSNTGNTIVLRDASGNFSAGTITANLSGIVTGNVTGSVSGSSRYLAHLDGPRNLTDRNPNWTARTAIFDFVGSGTTGTGGTYAGVLTFVPWDGATASTGDASYQLAFGSSATNGGGVPQLNIRNGIDTTWNSWYRIPLYGTNAGLSGGAIYATQFIDSDSTGYLCDPATTSVFNALINGTNGGTRLHLTSNGDLFSYYSTESNARIAIGRDIGISGGAGIGLGGSTYALIGTNDTAGTNFYIKLAAATSSITTSPNLALVSSGLSIAGSVTATQFIDGNNTNYYVDPGSTADTAVRIRGGAVYGPNTTWGAYLLVGGDGRQNYTDNTTTASVCATNGNLHLDSASLFNTYINWYDGTDLIVGAGGGSIQRLRVYGSSNYTEMSGSARAPLFYDVDDTAYYIDPTSGQANSEGGKIKWNFTVNGEGATSGRGLALYPSYTSSVPTYGITFAQTAYLGTHGNVTSDWATYFTMNSTANRGWVFRVVDGTPANVASINNAGRMRIASLGVGTDASATDGEIRATNNITAYYSDERLKTKLGPIQDPIEKVKSLSGFYFAPNDTAMALGYQKTIDVGVSAQEVNAILPEIIAPAPIDPQYMTVRYEKLIPLLIEAIKAQQSQIEELQKKISELQPNK